MKGAGATSGAFFYGKGVFWAFIKVIKKGKRQGAPVERREVRWKKEGVRRWIEKRVRKTKMKNGEEKQSRHGALFRMMG